MTAEDAAGDGRGGPGAPGTGAGTNRGAGEGPRPGASARAADAAELFERIAWTEERLAAGERVPLAPLAEAARELFRPAAGDLESASLALLRIARAVERAARLDLPDLAPAEEDEAAGAARPADAEDGEAAPDAWAERLAHLEAFQEVVRALMAYEREARRRFPRGRQPAAADGGPAVPELHPAELVRAFEAAWRRAAGRRSTVEREPVTVPERMEEILRLVGAEPLPFERLFGDDASRREVIVTFLALLELVRAGRVAVVQERPLAPITVLRRPEAGGR